MKIIYLLFTANILLNVTIKAILEDNLIIQYFQKKNINQITIFSQDNVLQYINLLNALMQNNIYISLQNINDDIEHLSIKHGSQGFVLDSEHENSSTILEQCAKQELFFDKYKWLIFSTNRTVIKILQNTYMNVNAEVTVALQNKSESSWELEDVYNPGFKHGGTLKVRKIGLWSPSKGLITNISTAIDLPKYIRRKDLSELQIKGIVVLVDKYPGDLLDYLYNNEENKTIDNFSRLYFVLFSHVKDIHNFTLSITLTPYYGAVSSNGSFNGLVGALQRKEIDVGLTSIYYKKDRSPYVDNLVPTYLMKTRFLFRHPKSALTIGGAFFSPLDNTVWMITWGVMILTAVIVRITFKEEWRRERERNEEKYTEHDWSFIALLIFGGICQQDVPQVPSMYSGRIIVFVSVFFTYMLYQFYSGGIVSSLLSEPPITIKNLKDLLNSDLKVGVEDIVYERMFFDETTDPVAIELFKSKMKGKKNGSDAFYDEKTGMELVQKGDFAFQTDTSTGYAVIAEEFTNEEICELGEVQLYPNQWMTGVVQQDSPFRELFVYSFQRMAEAGLIQRQRLRWTTRKPECIKVVDSSSIFVGIKEFFPALLFYIVGILITLLIFAAEIWVHRRTHSKKIKLVIIK